MLPAKSRKALRSLPSVALSSLRAKARESERLRLQEIVVVCVANRMRQFVLVKYVKHIHSKLIVRQLENILILTKLLVCPPDLTFGFTQIKSAQQLDHHNVMKMRIIHCLTPVTSFSSTMSTDLLSMQVCFICAP